MGAGSRTHCRGADGMRTILVPLENADCHGGGERRSQLVHTSSVHTKCSYGKGQGGQGPWVCAWNLVRLVRGKDALAAREQEVLGSRQKQLDGSWN